MEFTQDTRLMVIRTPLPEGTFLVRGLAVEESISNLFKLEVEVVSNVHDVDFEKMIGQSVTIELQLPSGGSRYFNGICARFSQGMHVGEMSSYRMELVPWLWLLTRNTDCRIFAEKTLGDILTEVFKEVGVAEFDFQLASSEPYEYVVQYNETDFDFCSRLMEEAGAGYFFTHAKNEHKLVVFDDSSANLPCPANATARFGVSHDGSASLPHERVEAFQRSQHLHTGAFAVTDYNMEDPGNDQAPGSKLLSTATSAIRVAGNDRYEKYEFPGRFQTVSSGEGVARRLSDIEDAHSSDIELQSGCPGFTPGHTFEMTHHRNSAHNVKYLITSLRHHATQATSIVGDDTVSSYINQANCIPSAIRYRPRRKTPRPVITGVHTAQVVETADPDGYGRVRVKFPWDRSDGETSCWIRVSQNWAGNTWGGMFMPHIEHEVLVGFLEGNPDRPIIVGRVYNAHNMPPLELPPNESKSIIRDHGGNEIVMEGEDGSQRISMYSPHGETKFNMGAPNSPGPGITLETALEQFVSIGGNVTEWFKADEDRTVDGNTTRQIQGNETNTTTGKKKEEIKGQLVNYNFSLKSDTTVGATHSLFAGGQYSQFYGYKHDVNRGWKKTSDTANVVGEF
ncbi:MAG: type VI secretion system tip protein VgrG, partial [Deltaproteobacteria bacterium]|nr:type VI secretion system tip protein VgrG [Deltaproteobacteria bacterium]